jgi:hypothetical protein
MRSARVMKTTSGQICNFSDGLENVMEKNRKKNPTKVGFFQIVWSYLEKETAFNPTLYCSVLVVYV